MRSSKVITFMVLSFFLAGVSPQISAAMTTPEINSMPAPKTAETLAPVAQATNKNVTPPAQSKPSEKKTKKRRKPIKPYYGPDTSSETVSVKDRLAAARKKELPQRVSDDDSEELTKDQTQPEKLTAAEKAKKRAEERAAKRKNKRTKKSADTTTQEALKEDLTKTTPQTTATPQKKPSSFKRYGQGRSSLLDKLHR